MNNRLDIIINREFYFFDVGSSCEKVVYCYTTCGAPAAHYYDFTDGGLKVRSRALPSPWHVFFSFDPIEVIRKRSATSRLGLETIATRS